jgi:beta-lactamase superfamily II metal-dependent hydrolase
MTKVMPFYSRKIDYIFIPSAVPAQIGGLIDVLDRYEVNEIIKPKYISTSTILSKLNTQISQKKIHVREVERGDRFNLDGVDVIVIFPNSDFKYNKTSLPELGLIFEYDKTQLFLIGNLSKTIQKYISKSLNASVSQNLLEFYNSNGKTKNSEDLLEKIKPEFIFSTKEKSISWVSDGFSWELFDSI